MLSVVEPREVETFNVTETAEFSIKANGKAFKVLIDGLYSDKIRAVIREIWSNAFDSHIAAGKADVPFNCHLPTVWEPHFAVRDYGTSLTHHGVMKLYTTVFESTKEDSNTQVGKLGLGSKSPFAYVDTFTVTAWLDGEKRMYSAYIGADYIPRISLMSTEPTDEEQGLEIAFPVKSDDIQDFSLAAQRVAHGFDTVPKTNVALSATSREVVVEGEGWKLYKTSDYGVKAHAKQGCVIYPIDWSAIAGLTDSQRSLLKSTLFIDFPIGDLEITASREGLGYDERTCKNIIARLDGIEDTIAAYVDEQLKGCKTMMEAIRVKADLRYHGTPECVQKQLESARWRGKLVQSTFYVDCKGARGATIQKWEGRDMLRTRGAEQYGTRHSFYRKPDDATVFYFVPEGEVILHKFKRMKDDFCYRNGGRNKNCIVVSAPRNSIALKRALVRLGRPDPALFIDVSKIEKITSAPGQYERKPVKVRVFNKRKADTRDWDQIDVTGGVYFDLDRGEIKDSRGASVGYSNTRDLIDALVKMGAIDGDVYAVPKTLSRITKADGWINLFDLVDKLIHDNYAEAASQRLWRLAEFFHTERSDNFSVLIRQLAQRGSHKFAPGVFSVYLEAMRCFHAEWQMLEDSHRKILDLTMTRGKFTLPLDTSSPIEVNEDLLKARYPLLAAMTEHMNIRTIVNYVDQRALVDYVNRIDASA